MEIDQILNEIRGCYLKEFSQQVAEAENHDVLLCSVETPKKKDDGQLVFSGPIRLPSRDDITLFKGGEIEKVLSVKADSGIVFDQKSILWKDKLAVSLSPFRWSGCRVVLSGLSQTSRWQPLKDWYMQWFDGNGEDSGEKFIHATHEIKGPRVNGEKVEFTVDFGSSPVHAFDGLLDALITMGYKKVELTDHIE